MARTITELNAAMDKIRWSDMPVREKENRLTEMRKQKVALTAQMVRMAKAAGYYDQ